MTKHTKTRHVVFKLRGQSHLAALKLQSIVDEYMRLNPIQAGGRNLLDLGLEWDETSAYILSEIEKRDPDLFKACGFDQQAIQINDHGGLFFRAYSHYPDIIAAPTKKPEFFMYAPISYDGSYFAPEDAIELSEADADIVGEKLFAGEWLGNGAILARKGQGVALPDDFDQSVNPSYDKSLYGREFDYLYFQASGESLKAAQDLKERQKKNSEGFNAIVDYLRQEISAIARHGGIKNLPVNAGKADVGATLGRDKNGKPRLQIRVSFNSRKTLSSPTHHAIIQSNDWFDVGDEKARETVITPHQRTPQAQKLYRLFQQIEDNPSIKDYPVLAAQRAFDPQDPMDRGARVWPNIHSRKDEIILQYRFNRGNLPVAGFCPQGAKPIDRALHEWLLEDQSDQRIGQTPPPMPADLYEKYKAAYVIDVTSSKATPPKTKPPRP
jgi:hypothetical protein